MTDTTGIEKRYINLLGIIVDGLSVGEDEVNWSALIKEASSALTRQATFLFLKRPEGWSSFIEGTDEKLLLPEDYILPKTEEFDIFPGAGNLKPVLMSPVKISGEQVAIFGIGGSGGQGETFLESTRDLLGLLTRIAAIMIEKSQALAFLEQRFVERSLELRKSLQSSGALDEKEEVAKLMVNKIQRPFEVISILSKSIYKEFHRAGFSTAHILHAAKELIEAATDDELKL